MHLIKNIFRIIIIVFLLIILFVIDLFSYTIEVEFVYPGSMHAIHANPKGANEDNGGIGLIATINGVDKKYNVGLGRIYFINSFSDPGYVDILQLAEVKFGHKYLSFGCSIWKMWIYGYFDEGDEIIVDVSPWPVFFLKANPFYYFDKNISISFRYVNFLAVSITFFTVNYEF